MRRALLAGAAALALTACAAAAIGLAGGEPGGPATLVGTYVWEEPWEAFGGWSAIEVSADGAAFVALSDRTRLASGRLARDPAGAVVGVEAGPARHLLDGSGRLLQGEDWDSEGLAMGPDGALWIGFEGRPRVRREPLGDSPPLLLPEIEAAVDLHRNGMIEAVAVDPQGRVLAIPETAIDGAFPVWRFAGGTWEEAFRIPAREDFVVAGADVGPDGRLVVVERRFMGLGFRSRLRRFDLDGTGEEVLLTTATGTHDNLEGVAVWADAAGLRATLISDDNFRFLQRTEIVDYRLPD